MASNISTFKSTINQGLARPNRYEVSITPFTGGGGFFVDSSDLKFTCEQVELPGMQFATNEDLIFGPIRKMPFLPVFNDLTMMFMCRENMVERWFFDYWMRQIYLRPIKSPSFLMRYFDDYKTTIEIRQLDQKNTTKYAIQCFECYPLEVVSQTLSAAETDTYLKLEVRIAFRYWFPLDQVLV